MDLAAAAPGIRLAHYYNSPGNFTGAVVPGYHTKQAWLGEEAARALRAVREDALGKGYELLVYDAYRPLRATRAMAAWAERRRPDLLAARFLARRVSPHNRGEAVDLTLVRAGTGETVDMGGEYAEFSERTVAANATGEARENRRLLERLMTAHGFRPYPQEWWHFTYRPARGPGAVHDVPYGCP